VVLKPKGILKVRIPTFKTRLSSMGMKPETLPFKIFRHVWVRVPEMGMLNEKAPFKESGSMAARLRSVANVKLPAGGHLAHK